jgi:aryl-alcohol dehydrogenase-like predicted oxidoreductase
VYCHGAGKVKYVGLSEVNAAQLRAAHSIYPVTCIEQEWSLWSRDIEADLIPTCQELGIGVLAYSPLGCGFLTGTLDAAALSGLSKTDLRVVGRPRMQVRHAHARNLSPPPGRMSSMLESRLFQIVEESVRKRAQGDNLEKNVSLVAQVKTLAARLACTPGQVALAWLYRRAADLSVTMVAIPGTKHVKYLEENVQALDVRLGIQDYTDLCRIFAPDAAAGDRYGMPHLMYSKE